MLNKDLLGTELYEGLKGFNEQEFSDLETARQAWWNKAAEIIIDHFTANAETVVPGTGLVAGPYPVTGTAAGTIK